MTTMLCRLASSAFLFLSAIAAINVAEARLGGGLERRVQVLQLRVEGNNGLPASAFPLGQCEGNYIQMLLERRIAYIG